MRNHFHLVRFGASKRASIAALSLLAVTACGRDPRQVPAAATWNSGTPATGRPSAIRHDAEITVLPSHVTFSLPRSWIEWHAEYHNNLYLSPQELAGAATSAHEWQQQFASICNALLPFDRCAAQVSSRSWGGLAGGTYLALHLRLYDLTWTSAIFSSKVRIDGLKEAQRLSGRPVALSTKRNGGWYQESLAFDLYFGDYGGTCHVDFRFRECNGHLLVFAFFYTEPDKDLDPILASFRCH